MSIQVNQIERYYDTHQSELEEEQELGQSRSHFFAIKYLLLILEWLFESKGQKVGIVSDINFYQTANKKEKPKQPDLAVVDGLEVVPKRKKEYSPSYYVGANGPPPRVVFEIASQNTWQADLEEKPAIYARMGVREYFVFDPQPGLGVWTNQWRDKERLVGWRLQADGTYVELAKDEQGRMWSEELESWLVAQGDENLFLYSAEGELRLNKAQAETQRAETERRNAEAERRNARFESRRADIAETKAELAQRKAEEEAQRANLESRRAEQEKQKAEAIEQVRQTLAAENVRLLEKLRQLEQKD